ncbi:MAG: hypothetical protein INR71_11230 [Terriglobus roseus]|nr:hypothetical protein [Terriglobus roseus]
MRLAKEQAEVGSSLFAQPRMGSAVPMETPQQPGSADASTFLGDQVEISPEERMLTAIARLEDELGTTDTTTLGDHLALLRRWYYRPEKQRHGVLMQQERGAWPVRKLVRAAARLAAPEPPQENSVPEEPESQIGPEATNTHDAVSERA